MVRIGGVINLSTFGAADDESEGGLLYKTIVEGPYYGNLGGNAD